MASLLACCCLCWDCHCLQEVEELCAEWEPEPLCPPLTAAQAAWREPVISSQVGTQVVVNGRQALNMASLNFLGIAGSAEVGARWTAER